MSVDGMTAYIVILVLLGIIFVVIPGLVIGISVPVSINKHRHIDFVESHSEALRKVKNINRRYMFAYIPNFNMSHIYDNNDFYPTVSPKDYLTYQLVYLDKKVSKALKDSLDNRTKYESYKKEITSCYYGKFDADTSDYNVEKLKKYEKEMVRDEILTPTTGVEIKVVLTRTDIGGNYQEKKSQIFRAEEIKGIINKLHQKRGDYYLNPDIWDSIVRVERAKVSNKLRFVVFQRDHERCVKCGSRRNLEVDHIYPISKGGKTEMSNLQTLCHRCNVRKGNSIE